ncbi:hypothetical protein OG562_24060 [Streptomyces sp. NBC_01275]|uniref:hypothetical protein n=1 Tax=Streptomyces sp. NBC_01275 TaxID=2903807 RepID=UPI00225AC995|nr:hypothetical protein [Streptomyces sp. NBC_01275]MCX4763979.1 hypothetical protein [Streptomyces sp. NBC_01275]
MQLGPSGQCPLATRSNTSSTVSGPAAGGGDSASLRESARVGSSKSHRLFDYSLSGRTDGAQPPYSAADLELSWVEKQDGAPCSYGLIGAEGRWRIPMGTRFLSVTPFRDGTAEVILNTDDASYDGPWTRIDTDGRILAAVDPGGAARPARSWSP